MQRIAVSIGTLQLHWENFANEAKECDGIGACLLSEIIDAADFMQRFLDHLLDRGGIFVRPDATDARPQIGQRACSTGFDRLLSSFAHGGFFCLIARDILFRATPFGVALTDPGLRSPARWRLATAMGHADLAGTPREAMRLTALSSNPGKVQSFPSRNLSSASSPSLNASRALTSSSPIAMG